MKKLIISVLLIIVTFITLDCIYGFVIEYMYPKSWEGHGYNAKQMHTVYHDDYDLLIMGSSRAFHHYIPEVLEKELNISVYNSGFKGTSIYYQYILLANLLKNHKPKYILLETGEEHLNKFENGAFSIDDIKRIMYFKGRIPNTEYIYSKLPYSFLYNLNSVKYNNEALSLAKGLFKKDSTKGFEALSGNLPIQEPYRSIDKDNVEDTEKLEILNDFCELCNKENIKLILVNSPRYLLFKKGYYNSIMDIAVKQNIDFIDYQNDSISRTVSWFRDVDHLNKTGALEYSKIVSKRLKKSLQCSM